MLLVGVTLPSLMRSLGLARDDGMDPGVAALPTDRGVPAVTGLGALFETHSVSKLAKLLPPLAPLVNAETLAVGGIAVFLSLLSP